MRKLSKREINELVLTLGTGVIAEATRSLNSNAPQLWADGRALAPPEQLERLGVIQEVLGIVAAAKGASEARAWFLGNNCDNMTKTPAAIIGVGRYEEAISSARRMAKGTLK